MTQYSYTLADEIVYDTAVPTDSYFFDIAKPCVGFALSERDLQGIATVMMAAHVDREGALFEHEIAPVGTEHVFTVYCIDFNL